MLNVHKPPEATGLSVADLRLAAISRRVMVSPSLAAVIVDLAYGTCRQDDVIALHGISVARVVAATGAPS